MIDAPVRPSIVVFEATLGLCRKRHVSIEEAEADVADFLAAARINLVSVAAKEASTALFAFSRYGKGRGHPAQLNMGDCFAYACARVNRAKLLFKREDFTKTDIPSARVGRADTVQPQSPLTDAATGISTAWWRRLASSISRARFGACVTPDLQNQSRSRVRHRTGRIARFDGGGCRLIRLGRDR